MKVIREGQIIVAYRHWFRWYFTLALQDRMFLPLETADTTTGKEPKL